jgi:hypothetical protein
MYINTITEPKSALEVLLFSYEQTVPVSEAFATA